MDERLAIIKTAMRVLKAITVKCDPEPADVEDLREFSPLLAAAPLDELACRVIRQMIKLTCDEDHFAIISQALRTDQFRAPTVAFLRSGIRPRGNPYSQVAAVPY